MTRPQQIQRGRLWQVYRDEAPDEILHEGSKTACTKFVRDKFGMRAWKCGDIRIGRLFWENGPKEYKVPQFVKHPYKSGGLTKMKTPKHLNWIGDTWTLERNSSGRVYITHCGGHTVALNDPKYPSAPDFHVPKYVLTRARKLLTRAQEVKP